MYFCISFFAITILYVSAALGADRGIDSLKSDDSSVFKIGIDTDNLIRTMFDCGAGIYDKSINYTKMKRVYNSLSTGYWSDKLALVPYREYLSIGKEDSWVKLVAQLLNQSFDVAGNSAEETSKKITETIHGGVSIFGKMHFTPVNLFSGNILTAIQTSMYVRTDIPEAPFLLIFSEKEGLKRGSDLDLTHMGLQFSLTTNFNMFYSRPVKLDGVLKAVKKFLGNLINIDNVSLVNGLTVEIGQAMLDVVAVDGGIHLKDDGTEMFADATFKIRSSGIGIRNDSGLRLIKGDGFPVSGVGAGINTGIVISGNQTLMTLGFRKIGPMIWKNMKEKELSIRTANIVIADIIEHNYDLFDESRGGTVSEVDTGNILKDSPAFICWLPAGLTLTLAHRFILKSKRFRSLVPEYFIPSFKYEQPLTSWTGLCSKPGVSCMNEFGMVRGWIPLRLGWSLGYGRVITSMVGIGVNAKRLSIQFGYEAIGTPYWYAKRGCTLYIGIFSG